MFGDGSVTEVGKSEVRQRICGISRRSRICNLTHNPWPN